MVLCADETCKAICRDCIKYTDDSRVSGDYIPARIGTCALTETRVGESDKCEEFMCVRVALSAENDAWIESLKMEE